jgi:hypothetical protein
MGAQAPGPSWPSMIDKPGLPVISAHDNIKGGDYRSGLLETDRIRD